jgi:hydrogenase expression/formation protein HypD
MGIGFETTAPAAAAAILQLEREQCKNFFLFSCHKLMPPVMQSLLSEKELAIDAFLCPGHVSTIIGARSYEFITAGGRAAVIAGFEPVDILAAVNLILEELTNGVSGVKLAYRRGVNENGNPRARAVLAEVFEPETVTWRGLGEIPLSGLKLKERFAGFDVRHRFDLPACESAPPSACRCGEVLRGLIRPDACALFGTTCNPATPFGPCMVSGEGSCAAYFRYPEK